MRSTLIMTPMLLTAILISGCQSKQTTASTAPANEAAPATAPASQQQPSKTLGKTPYIYGTTMGQFLLWPSNRILDAFDIVRLNLGFGPCLGLNVRATEWISFGMETNQTHRVGFPGSHRNGYYLQRAWYWKENEPALVTFSTLYTNKKSIAVNPDPTLAGSSTAPTSLSRKRGEVGATVSLLLISVDAAGDLSAAIDLVTGCFFYDFEEDDDQLIYPANAQPQDKTKTYAPNKSWDVAGYNDPPKLTAPQPEAPAETTTPTTPETSSGNTTAPDYLR